MKSNNPFNNHNLFWLSHSSISTWIQSPSKFIAEKLFNIKGESSASMHRGTAVEHGLAKKYTDGILDIFEIENKFTELCNFDGIDWENEKRQKEHKELKSYAQILERNFKYETLLGYQEKIEVQFDELPIPIIGYIDFIFDGVIVDLKTSARLPSKASESNKRQLAIYKMAYPTHETEVFYATPQKCNAFKLENLEIYQKQIKEVALGMMKFLSISNDKQELASMVLPDADDWKWSENTINEVKQKVQAWRYL